MITLTAMRELFKRGEIRKALVIAPLRVARDTWPEEIRKWDHLRGMTYAAAVGTAEERRKVLAASAQITLINRENVSWLVETMERCGPFACSRACRLLGNVGDRPSVPAEHGTGGTDPAVPPPLVLPKR